MQNLFFALDQGQAAPQSSGMVMIIYIVLLVAVFYFFMIRPQKKQEKQTSQMRNSLEIGDEITTIGGIIGRVTHIKDDVVTIESGADKNRIRIKRSAVAAVDVKNGEVKAPKGGYKVTSVKKGDEAKKSQDAPKLKD